MIDLHTHILPNVDDGVENIEQAVTIARRAEEQGITKLVATPHYLVDNYQLNPSEIRKRVKQLQVHINQQQIDLQILTGSEVYITPDLAKKVTEGLITTINNSRYILIELPMRRIPDYVENVLYDLQALGYKPIIAHPERYIDIIDNPNHLYYLAKQGILTQLNVGSLLGMYGSKVKKTAEILVKYNLVQLVGSDLHSNNRRRECLKEGYDRLEQLVGDQAEVYSKNGLQVINGQEVKINPKFYQTKSGLIGTLKTALGFS